MKKLAFIFALLTLVFFLPIVTGKFLHKKEKFQPPSETVILDREEDQSLEGKLKWIEQMHRSAPGDNWRLMDQQYRFANQAANRNGGPLPIYGKWRELGSNNLAGRTVFTFLDQINDKMYVASDGGQIWKADVGSLNWQSITDHLKIPAIRFMTILNDSIGGRLLVHSAEWNITGIMYSDDDGETWETAAGLEDVANGGYLKRAVVLKDAGRTIYCLSQEFDMIAWQVVSRIYKSTDHGESFYPVHTFEHEADEVDIWTSAKTEKPLFIVARNEFGYLDASDELVVVSQLPNPEEGYTLLTGFDDGAALFFYCMKRYGDMGHFFASGIDGQGWQESGTLDQGPFMQNSFSCSPSQKDLLYFGGMEAFFSFNAGAAWTKVNDWWQYYGSPSDKFHADITAFNAYLDAEGNEVLFISTDGGTYVSYDQMAHNENISMNRLRVSQYYSSYTCRFDPSVTHAASQDQGYQRSMEGMQAGAINYEQLISGDYGNMVSGDGGASIWMVYPGFAMYGPDINNTGQLILSDFVGSGYQWMPKLMEDPANPENCYMAGGHVNSGAHIMHLERNGGAISYTELPFDFSNGADACITAMAYSKSDPSYRYVLTSERDFFFSTDGGENWMQTPAFSGPGSHYFYGASIAVANQDPGIVYIGGSGYSNPAVFRSMDHGQTFTDFSEGLPNTMAYQIVLNADDSLLFAATTIGAFVCKTWEAQWYSLVDSVVPDQSFWAVDYIDTLKVARFSTYGRGVWDLELDPDVIADFAADETFILIDESVSFTDHSLYQPVSWNWYFEGGTPQTSTEQNPPGITYSRAGNFDVKLIVSNDHSSDTLLKENYIQVGAVGIVSLDKEWVTRMYPNPASSYFFLESIYPVDEIVIYTSYGKILKRTSPPGNAGKMYRIDLSGMDSGIYYIEIRAGNRRTTKKLILL